MGTGQMKGNKGQVPSDLVRGTARIPGLLSSWNKHRGIPHLSRILTKFSCAIRGDFLPLGAEAKGCVLRMIGFDGAC